MKKITVKQMTQIAIVAALYATLCLAFAPLSFGLVQFRIAEALTILAIFSPTMIAGVTIGCLIANSIGVAYGFNLPMDIVFGTLATLLAGILSYRLRNVRIKEIPVLASLMPVVVNAVIIGTELTVFSTGGGGVGLFFNIMSIGIEQIIPCMILGNLLVLLLEKSGATKVLRR